MDGIEPPEETIALLDSVDCLVLNATVDELDERWGLLDINGALSFWRSMGTQECIFTHMSHHSWKNGELIEGIGVEKTHALVKENIGLKIAYDGMRIDL